MLEAIASALGIPIALVYLAAKMRRDEDGRLWILLLLPAITLVVVAVGFGFTLGWILAKY